VPSTSNGVAMVRRRVEATGRGRDLLERARQIQFLRISGPRTASDVEGVLEPIFSGRVRADVAAAHLVAGDAQLAAGEKDKAREHWRTSVSV